MSSKRVPSGFLKVGHDYINKNEISSFRFERKQDNTYLVVHFTDLPTRKILFSNKKKIKDWFRIHSALSSDEHKEDAEEGAAT